MQRSTSKVRSPHRRKGRHAVRHRSRRCLSRLRASDHRGKHRTLSELQQGDPLVLVLSRGGFCPNDRRQHEGLLQLYREMQLGYCRLPSPFHTAAVHMRVTNAAPL